MIMLKVTNRASGRLVLRTVKVVLSSPHVRESKAIWDLRFHSVESGYQVLDSGCFVSGTWIPDSNR